MKNLSLLAAGMVLFFSGPSWAGDYPEAVEFPLNVTPADAEEKVEVRGQGDHSDRWITRVNQSKLTVYLPEASTPPTAAVVICPGGGYTGLSYDKEGTFVAKWMRERGVAVGVLKYRTGGGVNGHPAPLEDAQLAMQTMRASAKRFGYSADKIGVLGFSAGGHLAATAGTQYVPAQPQRADAAVRCESSRPDFLVLVYPVISMEIGTTHGGSRRNLLGDSPTQEACIRQSADHNVTADTAPAFLVHCSDDGGVPVENSLRFYKACVQHKVPVEMHLFDEGGHGFGMWREDLPVGAWPELLEAWMTKRGFMGE